MLVDLLKGLPEALSAQLVESGNCLLDRAHGGLQVLSLSGLMLQACGDLSVLLDGEEVDLAQLRERIAIVLQLLNPRLDCSLVVHHLVGDAEVPQRLWALFAPLRERREGCCICRNGDVTISFHPVEHGGDGDLMSFLEGLSNATDLALGDLQLLLDVDPQLSGAAEPGAVALDVLLKLRELISLLADPLQGLLESLAEISLTLSDVVEVLGEALVVLDQHLDACEALGLFLLAALDLTTGSLCGSPCSRLRTAESGEALSKSSRLGGELVHALSRRIGVVGFAHQSGLVAGEVFLDAGLLLDVFRDGLPPTHDLIVVGRQGLLDLCEISSDPPRRG